MIGNRPEIAIFRFFDPLDTEQTGSPGEPGEHPGDQRNRAPCRADRNAAEIYFRAGDKGDHFYSPVLFRGLFSFGVRGKL